MNHAPLDDNDGPPVRDDVVLLLGIFAQLPGNDRLTTRLDIDVGKSEVLRVATRLQVQTDQVSVPFGRRFNANRDCSGFDVEECI